MHPIQFFWVIQDLHAVLGWLESEELLSQYEGARHHCLRSNHDQVVDPSRLYRCELVALKARLVAVSLKKRCCPVETRRAWYVERDKYGVGCGELNASQR